MFLCHFIEKRLKTDISVDFSILNEQKMSQPTKPRSSSSSSVPNAEQRVVNQRKQFHATYISRVCSPSSTLTTASKIKSSIPPCPCGPENRANVCTQCVNYFLEMRVKFEQTRAENNLKIVRNEKDNVINDLKAKMVVGDNELNKELRKQLEAKTQNVDHFKKELDRKSEENIKLQDTIAERVDEIIELNERMGALKLSLNQEETNLKVLKDAAMTLVRQSQTLENPPEAVKQAMKIITATKLSKRFHKDRAEAGAAAKTDAKASSASKKVDYVDEAAEVEKRIQLKVEETSENILQLTKEKFVNAEFIQDFKKLLLSSSVSKEEFYRNLFSKKSIVIKQRVYVCSKETYDYHLKIFLKRCDEGYFETIPDEILYFACFRDNETNAVHGTFLMDDNHKRFEHFCKNVKYPKRKASKRKADDSLNESESETQTGEKKKSE